MSQRAQPHSALERVGDPQVSPDYIMKTAEPGGQEQALLDFMRGLQNTDAN